jgi:integrase
MSWGKHSMTRIRLKHVVADIDRHGNVRYYYRIKAKPKIRLRGAPGSEEFMAAYAAAERGELLNRKVGRQTWPAGSLGALCESFYHSEYFHELTPRSQRVRQLILDGFCNRGNNGSLPFKFMLPRHVRKQRDLLRDKPGAATNLIKALRHLFKYAVQEDLIERNPADEVGYLRRRTEGFHSWTTQEVCQFEAHWPIGTKPRLAMALLLYTGQRRSDVVTLGRQHERDGVLYYRQLKTGMDMATPILPQLRKVLNASPCGDLTFLVTHFNRPYTANGFGNAFRDWCNAANLPKCSAHGLRKAGAVLAAENGATESQLQAIFGWESMSQAAHYTRAARRNKMAADAIHLIALEREANEKVPLSSLMQNGGTKRRGKAK